MQHRKDGRGFGNNECVYFLLLCVLICISNASFSVSFLGYAPGTRTNELFLIDWRNPLAEVHIEI